MTKSRVNAWATGAFLALALALVVLASPALARSRSALPVMTSAATASSLGVSVTSLPSASPSPASSRVAYFFGETPSKDARRVADWVVASGDNHGFSFIIVDKISATVFVFDREGQLRGATSALLGLARGDDAAPGIGDKKLSLIPPDERTTPAGRFVAQPGRDLENDVLWIDYGNSLALHRAVRGRPADHRLQRLATSSPADKRITYGCVEVSTSFYDDVVDPTFAGSGGIIYILPEIKTVQNVFPEVGSTYIANSNEAPKVADLGLNARS